MVYFSTRSKCGDDEAQDFAIRQSPSSPFLPWSSPITSLRTMQKHEKLFHCVAIHFSIHSPFHLVYHPTVARLHGEENRRFVVANGCGRGCAGWRCPASSTASSRWAATTARWPEVEKALAGHSYTVFAGHIHIYQRTT